MKISYIAYGFFKLITSILLGIFIGSFLIFINFDEKKAYNIALIFAYFMLIFSGYSFVENCKDNRYKNSLLLSLLLTFSFLFFYCLIEGFDIIFIFKNFLIVMFFFGVGILFNYLKFKKRY